MNYEEMTMGRRIAVARTAKGLGQKELAESIGKTSGGMSLIEAGKREPSVKTVTAIAEKLEVSAGWIMTGKE